MKVLGKDGRVFAISGDVNNLKESKTEWFGSEHESLQVAGFNYNEDKRFETHRHIMRARLSNYSQECLIVMNGSIYVSVYDLDKHLLYCFVLKVGQFVILYRGYHGILVKNKDSRFIEVKNGPFTTVAEDKEHL